MGHTADDFDIDGNLNVDGNAVVDGTSLLTGAVTATAGVTGAVTGAVTGNVAGNIAGATSAMTTTYTTTGPNGSSFTRGYVTELLVQAQAAETASTIAIPAGASNVSVSAYVTGLAATTATYNVGITGDTARFITAMAVAAGSTATGREDAPDTYAAATTLLVTPNASPTDDAGIIRFVIFYDVVVAPTS